MNERYTSRGPLANVVDALARNLREKHEIFINGNLIAAGIYETPPRDKKNTSNEKIFQSGFPEEKKIE